METIKQQVLGVLRDYNQGRPVSYPSLDRKMMAQHPDLVKSGRLGAVLEEMVAESLIKQVGPSSYQACDNAE
jgi:hypothetical protein